MAKVTITIEDRDGEVCTETHPSVHEIAKRSVGGHGISPAEAYAITAVKAVILASAEEKKKQQLEKQTIWTPTQQS
jgi:hypothetical protein